MNLISPVWQRACAATLSLTLLSACNVDPALLAAIAKSAAPTNGATPVQPQAGGTQQAPGVPMWEAPTSGGMPVFEQVQPPAPEVQDLMSFVMAVDSWMEQVENEAEQGGMTQPAVTIGAPAYRLAQNPPPPPPGAMQQGQFPPPQGGMQQGQPGQFPPPPGGVQQGQPGQFPPPPGGVQQGQPGQFPPPPGGMQQGQPGQFPPPPGGMQQGQPGQFPPPPGGMQQGQTPPHKGWTPPQDFSWGASRQAPPGAPGQPGESWQAGNMPAGAGPQGPARDPWAAKLAENIQKNPWRIEDGPNPRMRLSLKVTLGDNPELGGGLGNDKATEGERQSDIEQRFDANGDLQELIHKISGKGPDGRSIDATRTKKFQPDGSHTVTFEGTINDLDGHVTPLKWSKFIRPDGAVEGRGELGLRNAPAFPFKLGGNKPGMKKPRKFPKLGGPASIGPVRPMPDRAASGSAECTDADQKLGESGKAPTSGVLSIQVEDDRMVMAGGAAVQIRFTGRGTNLGKGLCTYVNVFDALRTSDPASGGTPFFGVASGASYNADGLGGTVTIDPKSLEKRSYWLRFSTKMPDGTWEVAEGVLMTH